MCPIVICVAFTHACVCVQQDTTVKILGETCTDEKIRNFVAALGWFCRRYKLDRRPEHSTKTCVVYLATALATNSKETDQRVAIKFMSNATEYLNEISLRKGIDPRF